MMQHTTINAEQTLAKAFVTESRRALSVMAEVFVVVAALAGLMVAIINFGV